MKKGIVIVGVIVLVIGLITMLFMWPMIGTIDSEELAEKMLEGESGTFKVMEEMEEDDWDAMDDEEKEAAKDIGIDGPGTYVATVELDDGIPKDEPEWEKVPTLLGILGLVIMIVGIILLIVGVATGRAAPVAPAQPPMEQPPYQQPPMQQPPYQQPPYQQPPPQQPPMPPPPPPR